MTSEHPTRRAVLAGTVAGLAAGLLAARPALAAPPRSIPPPRLTLPPPTGPYPVGTVALHLVDRNRSRELMVSLWYPARHAGGYPVVPWLPAGAARRVLAANGLDPDQVRVPLTHGHDGAPVDRRGGRLPVVLYSPGNDAYRSANTVVTEQLASHGYLVVTIDHPGDSYVEFPDGRVLEPLPDGPLTRDLAAARVADVRFVLDRLGRLDTGADVDRHRLPAGLAGSADPSRVGMFGHSAGAFTVAATMYEDRRIGAGLSLDGGAAGPVVQAGLDRPYLLLDATKSDRFRDPDLAMFWSRLGGWRLDLRVTGAGHASFTDEQALIPQLGVPAADAAATIGTIDPRHALAVQRAYPLAFFDLHLRHRGHLLDGPSSRYPDVVFLP